MSNKTTFAVILLSGGYELALDRYVIPRTLMIIFVLSFLFKLGLVLVEQKTYNFSSESGALQA
ncbi:MULTISPECIES: hypothetical protein [Sporosarcina]|uniref:hypothetical protein n=1 Tax=Sporosarcina TaxID=1569 RepID=UPI000A152F86|nr:MULTISPECIES: hypothetical protein [Sporosarcina]ARJ39439.1 hypothetical protein SporoP8_11470 [Sporosarcina ureae]PIC94160.1 hypothetical protein CSV70_00030 [Sporosarcina sp. P25]